MTYTLQINTDNAAFSDGDEGARCELARILRDLAAKLEHGADIARRVYDFNGNAVGVAELVDA